MKGMTNKHVGPVGRLNLLLFICWSAQLDELLQSWMWRYLCRIPRRTPIQPSRHRMPRTTKARIKPGNLQPQSAQSHDVEGHTCGSRCVLLHVISHDEKPVFGRRDVSSEVHVSGEHVEQPRCSCSRLTEEHAAGPQRHQEHRVELHTVLTDSKCRSEKSRFRNKMSIALFFFLSCLRRIKMK